MRRGISINIGVSKPSELCCVTRELKGCEADAETMASIARAAGFEVAPPLTGSGAKIQDLEAELRVAARRLRTGDTLLLSFAGHGCQDREDGCTESDCLREAWCLADGVLDDDRLHDLWEGFKEDVRILVVSDSCHAEGMNKLEVEARRKLAARGVLRALRHAEAPKLALPCPAPEYRKSRVPVVASVLIFAAAKENQNAQDGTRNGLFTRVLRVIWERNGGHFDGNYTTLCGQVAAFVSVKNSGQTPTLATTGRYPFWMNERPFSL